MEFVNRLLALTQSKDYWQQGDLLPCPQKQAEVKKYERQIDQLVYKLYNLTAEEIKIVEGEEK